MISSVLNKSLKPLFATVLTVLSLVGGQSVWAQDPSSIGSINYNNTLGAYEINCANNLHDLAVYVNGAGDYTTSGSETTAHNCEGLTFKMTADIDIPHTTEWNDANSTEDNYTAIGGYVNSSWKYFKGTFDGQHHTASGIRIVTTDYGKGLFGAIQNAIVMNVNLSGIRIQGSSSIGAVVGSASAGSIVSGCQVTDSFFAGGSNYGGSMGGVVGRIIGSTLSDCHVSATVTICATVKRTSGHGGVVGECSNSSDGASHITGCSTAATLSIADGITECKYFGGIVGNGTGRMKSGSNSAVETYAYIENCRALGVTVPATTESNDVTSGAIVGRIKGVSLTDNYYLNCTVAGTANAVNIGIGINDLNTSDHISGTHSLHTVTLESGMFISGTNIIIGSDIYYPSGKTMTLGGGTGYTVTVDGSNPVTYVPVAENAGVYTFSMPSGNITVSGAPDFDGLWHADDDHDGTTAERAYIITTTDGLNLLASMVNLGNTYSGKYFKLDADISYDHTTDWDDASSTENNFVAIGNPSDGNNTKFSGIFDGCDHTVSGIRIYNPSGNHMGLFGSILNATVKNVRVADIRITGKSDIGGIAGTSQSSDIDNCHVSATVAIHSVVNSSQFHGGIVGTNWKYSTSVNSRVLNCTSSVRLTKTGNLSNCGWWGGIVGSNNGTGAVVSNCFATGVYVDDWGRSGAVVGSNVELGGSNEGTLSNNYYNGCMVSDHISNIGHGISGDAQDVTVNDGARGIGKITPGERVSVVSGTTVVVNTETWYYSGQSVTLSHTDYAGYSFNDYIVLIDGTTPASTVDVSNSQFTMPAKDVTVTAAWRKLLTNADITIVDIPSQEYTGSALIPVVNISDGSTPLVENTDYNVTLPEGRINTGDYTITLTGIGDYSGTVEKTFTITPVPVTLTANSRNTDVYDGTEKTVNGYTCNVDGLTFSSVTASGSGTNTGSYNVTFTGVILNTTTDDTGNYIVTATTNGTLTILPYVLTEAAGITDAIATLIANQDVQFSRTFTENTASTICLPFTMTSISGGKVYEFVGVEYDAIDGWVATMSDATPGGNNVTTTLANKPYLFMPNATGEVVFNGTASATILAGTTVSGDWTFHGTYSYLSYGSAPFNGTVFGFAATSGTASDGVSAVEVGQFVKAADGAFIQPFRAYLTYSGSNQVFHAPGRDRSSTSDIPDRINVRLIGSDGNITAVGTIDPVTGDVVIEHWYDINGRDVEGTPSSPGIYLNNGGKKVMIK